VRRLTTEQQALLRLFRRGAICHPHSPFEALRRNLNSSWFRWDWQLLWLIKCSTRTYSNETHRTIDFLRWSGNERFLQPRMIRAILKRRSTSNWSPLLDWIQQNRFKTSSKTSVAISIFFNTLVHRNALLGTKIVIRGEKKTSDRPLLSAKNTSSVCSSDGQ